MSLRRFSVSIIKLAWSQFCVSEVAVLRQLLLAADAEEDCMVLCDFVSGVGIMLT